MIAVPPENPFRLTGAPRRGNRPARAARGTAPAWPDSALSRPEAAPTGGLAGGSRDCGSGLRPRLLEGATVDSESSPVQPARRESSDREAAPARGGSRGSGLRPRRRSPARRLLPLAALLLAAPGAHAAEVVGRVLSAVGPVTAVVPEGPERALERRSPIHQGETLVTGAEGRAQVRFADRGLVALRPGSRLRVKRYTAEPGKAEEPEAVLELLEGGLRTITGTVSDTNRDGYRMETPAASIGIRGTVYALAVGEAGLHGGVQQGRIEVRNQAGAALVEAGTYFHVAAPTVAPEQLMEPPRPLLKGWRGELRGQGKAESPEEWRRRPDAAGPPGKGEAKGRDRGRKARPIDALEKGPGNAPAVDNGPPRPNERVRASGNPKPLPPQSNGGGNGGDKDSPGKGHNK
ncbi:FecR family protein [Thiohalorhabdus sp. Cl-TMA]|uniref:FecR domain-containing protein n=1 Tax=Thiohalorhabdus methylotrophus TaxID=3242694 RepID=A0ABV4TVN9_9GAMM